MGDTRRRTPTHSIFLLRDGNLTVQENSKYYENISLITNMSTPEFMTLTHGFIIIISMKCLSDCNTYILQFKKYYFSIRIINQLRHHIQLWISTITPVIIQQNMTSDPYLLPPRFWLALDYLSASAHKPLQWPRLPPRHRPQVYFYPVDILQW